MTLASDPIARKELVLDKIIIKGLDMQGGDDKGAFAAESHLHSYTRAFGDPERREGIWLLRNDVVAFFDLPSNFNQHAYQLKFLAMMEQWRNTFVDIAILLNGHLLRRGPMLFENVVLGWPANCLALSNQFLRPGKNFVTFQNHSPLGKREALFINQAEIFIRPKDAPFQFELAPTLVRTDEPFQVRIRNTTGRATKYQVAGEFKFLSHSRQTPLDTFAPYPIESSLAGVPNGPEDVFVFRTPSTNASQCITFSAGTNTLCYQPDQIAHAAAPYDLLIGSDISDDRQDETTLALLDFFDKTEMGNIIGFRPMLGRSCVQDPSEDLFCQWFDFLKARGMKCWLEGGIRLRPWITPRLMRKYPNFLASKFHEICNDIALNSASLRDLKHAQAEFEQLISKKVERYAIPGSPFWLCSCTAKVLLLAASKHVDLPIIEPTTHDHMVMYSAIRKTACLHNKRWGSHIPPNWFLGTEGAHSEDKLRRFQLSLNAAHIMGAKVIYSESALFGFQPFKRYDAEHPISQQMRIIMRNFYRYTRTQSIPSTKQSLASANILYGNNDSFFFFHDNFPIDTGRSTDRQLWYKWPFTDIDRAWMAARTLFKPLNSNEYKGYPGDAGEVRFSSNPNGSVDIIPIADLKKSPLPLTFLLGRNLMTPAIYKSLISYVKNGGTLLLSLHHFNTNPDPAAKPTWLNDGNLTELLGTKLKFSSKPAFLTHNLGKGAVICYTGETPMGNPNVRPFVDEMIQSLAAKFRPAIHITNDAPVYLQQYQLDQDFTQLFLLNVNWKVANHLARAQVSIAGKEFPVDVPFGPPTILYHTPVVTFSAASPLTQIYNLRHVPTQTTFTACGKNLEIFTLFAHRPIKSVLVNNQPVAFHSNPARPDILQFSAPLNHEAQITIRH